MPEKPHLPCPFEACGSSDAFSYNTDGYGKCHSCGESYPKRGAKLFSWAKQEYPVKSKETEKQIQKRLREMEPSRGVFEGIRGIKPDICKLYGIQLQLDSEGNPLRYAFQYPNNVKYRIHEEVAEREGIKKFYWMKTHGNPLKDLFGPDFNSGSSKRLYITEGEFDAASLYQALGETFPVRSLSSASCGEAFLQHNLPLFEVTEELVYAGELDEAGRKSADKFYSVNPKKMSYVPLTKFKDANEFIMNDEADALKWAALKPQRYSPQNFFTGDDEWEQVIRDQNPYRSSLLGHKHFDYMMRGLVRGGLTLVKAKRGLGKTELFRFAQYNVLTHEDNKDVKIGLVHMEEMLSTTLRCFATYELGVNVRTRQDQEENGISDEEVIKAAKKIKGTDRIIPFELLSGDEPERIVEYVRLAATVYGADFVFIDHVQRLIYRNGAENATGTLTQIGSQLAELGKELDIGVICISHLNKEGGTQYASALENEAIIIIDVERNMESEDDREKNTSEFKVTKNRPFSRLGSAGKVYYDPQTTIMEEVTYEI